ncbi:MAG: WbqC family protein [Planctomycetota bacterium]
MADVTPRRVAAAHQPNFLPWLGYFYKLAHCDRFLIVDSVQFSKGSYTNRVRLPVAGKTTWLTVPVRHASSTPLITEVVIGDTKFPRKHLNTLRAAYGKSPHFDEVFALLEPVYNAVSSDTTIDVLNLGFIDAIRGYLGIGTPMVRLSELDASGRNNEFLAAACAEMGCDLYVAGKGARSYMEGAEEVYEASGVETAHILFSHPEYPQKADEFIPGCSIIDALFALGRDTFALLQAQTSPPWAFAATPAAER